MARQLITLARGHCFLHRGEVPSEYLTCRCVAGRLPTRDGSARSWLRQDRTQLRNGLRSSSGQCQVVASPCRQSAAGQSHGFRFGYATAVVTQGAAMMQKDASVGGKAPEIGTLLVKRSEEHT